MYNENFKYVVPNVEDERRFAENAVGNFLFYIKGCFNIRLFIHLDKAPNTSFYCIYRPSPTDCGYEIVEDELKVEGKLGYRIDGGTFFHDLRSNRGLQHIGWQERVEPICQEEINFLTQLKPDITL